MELIQFKVKEIDEIMEKFKKLAKLAKKGYMVIQGEQRDIIRGMRVIFFLSILMKAFNF